MGYWASATEEGLSSEKIRGQGKKGFLLVELTFVHVVLNSMERPMCPFTVLEDLAFAGFAGKGLHGTWLVSREGADIGRKV